MPRRTYCENGEGSSCTFTQQLVQLLFGKSVHNKTKDEKGRKEKSQNPTQEGVKTDASVVRHISPVCAPRGNLILIFAVVGNA